MAIIQGQVTVNEVLILEVDSNPASGAGTPAPIGSLAIVETGALFQKTGALDTQWTQFEAANGGIVYGTPVGLTPDSGNIQGVSTDIARADHQHDVPTEAPVSVGTANAEGTAQSFSRSDHVHAHGNQAGGSLHSVATTSTAGFMSATDKTKLDALNTKSGRIAAVTFTGNPKKATVTFVTPFPSANYSVTVTGSDARSWTIESKTASSFIINANANAALTGEVGWQAQLDGEVS